MMANDQTTMTPDAMKHAFSNHHSPSAIDLICFDLGRVLVDICSGWREACERAGVAFAEGLDDVVQRRDVVDLAMEHELGRIDAETFDRRLAHLLDMPAAAVAAVCSAWLKQPCEGTEIVLDRVCGRVMTACLSNTNDRHWRMMRGLVPSEARLPLDRLDHHFTSHLIGAMKPDPAIYEHVEKTTGITPQRIAFFDDLVENVEAARQRGWQAVHIDPNAPSVPQMQRVLEQWGW